MKSDRAMRAVNTLIRKPSASVPGVGITDAPLDNLYQFGRPSVVVGSPFTKKKKREMLRDVVQ